MSYFNQDVLGPLGGWYRPLLGRDPYNKKVVEDSSKAALKAVSVVEEHLFHNTYLVGERITLADLFAVGIITRGFEFFFDKKWRSENPNITRWYETIYNQPVYSAVAPPFALLDVPALTNAPPKKPEQAKKEEKPKKEAAPKAAPKPKEAEEEEEDAAPAEPKPKHPLDLLPRSSFALDDYKRFYSNNDTPVAMKYLWETVPFEEYSLWKVEYKYNDELTLTFMSNNLIGGFNNRLEGSRKYLFGCMSVYGTNNDSIIEGAFLVRGQEYEPVFNVAPDYESYKFTKLSPTSEEDKTFVDAQWTWDRPVVVGDKSYAHAAGKVFK